MMPESIRERVETLIATINIPELFRQYNWKNDNWQDGFKEILQLEKDLSTAAKEQRITTGHIIEIARWGGRRDIERIRCNKDPLVFSLYDGDEISAAIQNDPVTAVRVLKDQTTGIGPTYISKVLRFAAPLEYGVIDSRLVRVFGIGDEKSRKIHLLNLQARPGKDGRWAIAPVNWPGEYGTWIAILHQIARNLNAAGIRCPHPKQFYDAGLRQSGEWLPADVEMALFTYASMAIYGRPDKSQHSPSSVQ
ncbi:MAG: hypothetical protein WCX22_06080 [Methanoregula sp.]